MRYTLTRSLYLVALVAFLYGLADGAGILSVYFGGTGSDLSAMTPLNLVKKDTAGGANRWIDAGTTGKGNTGAAGSPTATSPLTFSSGVVACPTCVTGPASTNVLFVGLGTATDSQYATWGGGASWNTYGTKMIHRPWSAGFLRNFGLYINALAAAGSSTSYRFVVNTPNMTTALGVTSPPISAIGAMTLGTEVVDWNTTVPFAAGSRIGLFEKDVGSVSGSLEVGVITAEMGLDDGSGIYLGSTTSTGATLTAGSTGYLPPFGFMAATAFPTVTAGTFSRLCGALASNGTGGTAARMTLQVDGVDSVLYTDLGTGVTDYCDTGSQTVHVTVGQRITTKWVNNRTTSVVIGGWSAKFVPDSGATVGVLGGEFGSSLSGTQYWSPGYDTATSSSAYSSAIMPRSGIVTKGCITTSGALASGIPVTIYKNLSLVGTLLTTTAASGIETQCGAAVGFSFNKGDTLAIRTVFTSGSDFLDMWGINF